MGRGVEEFVRKRIEIERKKKREVTSKGLRIEQLIKDWKNKRRREKK